MIAKALTQQLGPESAWSQSLIQLNQDILATIIAKYPLRGFVVQMNGDQAMINLGSNQGMVEGTVLTVKGIYDGRKFDQIHDLGNGRFPERPGHLNC